MSTLFLSHLLLQVNYFLMYVVFFFYIFKRSKKRNFNLIWFLSIIMFMVSFLFAIFILIRSQVNVNFCLFFLQYDSIFFKIDVFIFYFLALNIGYFILFLTNTKILFKGNAFYFNIFIIIFLFLYCFLEKNIFLIFFIYECLLVPSYLLIYFLSPNLRFVIISLYFLL